MGDFQDIKFPCSMILQTQFLFNGIISYFAEQFKSFLQSPLPITPKACISSCSAGTVYHQCEALYIIKPQGKCTLTRDEIQGRNAPLMICTARCAAMIYQARGLDSHNHRPCRWLAPAPVGHVNRLSLKARRKVCQPHDFYRHAPKGALFICPLLLAHP